MAENPPFQQVSTWVKQNGSLSKLTMGSNDGEEVCKMVGLFFLHQLTQLISMNNIGLYRGDGLAILDNVLGFKLKCFRKKITKLFRDHDLKIIAKANCILTDFLDINLNLKLK